VAPCSASSWSTSCRVAPARRLQRSSTPVVWPQAGLGDIKLPERQAGSSIMPGKVDPVICEVVNQVTFMVLGADVVVAIASEAGQLQLNAFEPVMCHSLLMSEKWLTSSMITLRENCVAGITVDRDRLQAQALSFLRAGDG
jgi:aspartate ammonia-lyase